MAEKRRHSSYRRPWGRIILIGGIAAASILYTKAGQRNMTATENEETAIAESRVEDSDKQNPPGSFKSRQKRRFCRFHS